MDVTVHSKATQENAVTSLTLHRMPVTVLVGMVEVISFILHVFPARLTGVHNKLIANRGGFQRHVMLEEMLVELLNG